MPHRAVSPGRTDRRATRPAERATTSRPGAARRALVAAVAATALVGAACSGPDDEASGATTTIAPAGPAPSVIPAEDASTPTIPVPADWVAPDSRGVALRPVVGDPVPEPDWEDNVLPMEGGEAEIRVTVVGPEGTVDGGVVRFERFEGQVRGWIDVPVAESGLAVLADAPGGRYRVRAWREPVLTSTESQTLFLARNEDVDLRVRVEPHEAPVLQGALVFPVWQVADTVGFDALLVRERVEAGGIIGGEPLPGELTLTPIAGARVDTDNPVLTDPATGRASFGVVCLLPGIHQATLSGYGLTTTVELPYCRPSGIEPPPSPASDDSAPGDGTTPVDLPVGGHVTPPFPGVVPAGTYISLDPAARCSTSYETLQGTTWVRRQTSGPGLELLGPTRDLVAADGTTPCTFRRTR